MRALVQGMDERAAWDRFLRVEGDGGNRHQIRATVQWIRDAFAASARRHQRPGYARLILIDAQRVRDSTPTLPSLQEFALAQGLEDFSEAEQLEAYAAAYPGGQGGAVMARRPDAATRRQHLIARQLEALQWLETLVAVEPRPADAVQAWIGGTSAAWLARAGIATLRELVDFMNTYGARWWTRVPGVGRHKAGRVTAWLRAHAPQMGLALGAHAFAARASLSEGVRAQAVAPASALRPLEKFVVPPALDGARGALRAPRQACRIPADSDYEAIACWIRAKAPPGGSGALSATQRSYRKEAERLLLWATLERGRALSSLQAPDAVAFVDFLAAPSPAWCGPRSGQRWTPAWRPLEGPLRMTARRQAIVILHGLYAYLVRQGYVLGNPFATLLNSKGPGPIGPQASPTSAESIARN